MKHELNLKITLLLILTNILLFSYSQKAPSKFGKISVNELKSEVCPIDSSAHAYYIFDFGESYFEYADTKLNSSESKSSQKGFQLFFKRHLRIKIIDNQAFSWANFEIPLYRNDEEEKIVRLKACTYNLENNKVVKTKLNKDDIYSEETSKYWITKKFAMPAVREGSVIEIEYTIKSDFYFNLKQWCFQQTIPVLQSEYHVRIPEYFNYNQTEKGYFPIQLESSSKRSTITITYHQKAQASTVTEQTYTNTYDYREDVFDYYAKEIPAFPIEKYLRTKENYLSKYEFELNFTKFPNSQEKYYTTSWEEINEDLLDNFRFGKEMNKTSHIKQDVEALQQTNQKDIVLINSAFNLVKNKFAWNEYMGIYPTSSLSKAYKKGEGNCADINLNLIMVLRELGFDANPVVLSTQANGILHPAHPSLSRLNYVIAMVKIDSNTLLMDATDPYSEINLLPVRCLNDKGRVVNNTNGEWINLMNNKPTSKVEVYDLKINNSLEMQGTSQIKLKDYAAYMFKKEIKKHNNTEEYKSSLEKESKEYKINKYEVVGLDSIQDNIKISIDFSQNNFAEQSNDIAFFTPVYQPFITENPFKLEKREYPVEFNYPFTLRQIYTIQIPENYSISGIPKPLRAQTSDGKMIYIYNINQLGDKIILSIMFTIKKTLCLPDEYQDLKEFYQTIEDKQKEFVVIKKAQ